MRIAVLGGSFDPVHNGHLQIAKTALKKLAMDEVWFMPTYSSPLKQGQQASYYDRVQMISKAIAPYRHMKVCTLEAKWEDSSYTIRSVKELKRVYPQHSFVWLIGEDQAQQFENWKESEQLKKLIPFYVFSRTTKKDKQIPKEFHRIAMDLIDVSSSHIREGKELDKLPTSVGNYIGAQGLYLDEMIKDLMNQKRYEHSLSVAGLCVELAHIHHLDETKAYIMGICHDVCKEMPKDKAKLFIQYHCPQFLSEDSAIWHGYIGADYVHRIFHIQDKEIREAIYHHVKGRGKNDYDRILFICDKLDPSRGYDSSKEIELCRKDLKKGFEVVKRQQHAYLKEEKREVHE